jgi:hypothetical protein
VFGPFARPLVSVNAIPAYKRNKSVIVLVQMKLT